MPRESDSLCDMIETWTKDLHDKDLPREQLIQILADARTVHHLIDEENTPVLQETTKFMALQCLRCICTVICMRLNRNPPPPKG